MFLVKDRRLGLEHFVFMQRDPRDEGFTGEVVDDVSLDYDMDKIHIWPNGHPRPNPQLGQDPKNPKHYKVFKFPEGLQEAGFEFVSHNTPLFALTWKDYRTRYYPVPEEFAQKMTQEEWFEYLEDADSAAKIRKHAIKPEKPKKGSTRDEVAEWVAKRHMTADVGIIRVVYLPTGSPPDEIRLMEVSERVTDDEETVEPIDFGLDVEGAKFKLLVADVSVEQVEKIKKDPATKLLPKGWSIHEAITWGRRDGRP